MRRRRSWRLRPASTPSCWAPAPDRRISARRWEASPGAWWTRARSESSPFAPVIPCRLRPRTRSPACGRSRSWSTSGSPRTPTRPTNSRTCVGWAGRKAGHVGPSPRHRPPRALLSGFPVYVHQDPLPDLGARLGKGEALWKSLFVTRGDLVVWIDTDIVNIHPRFVYGVLGPLLNDRRVQFGAGFDRRPLRVGDRV